MLDALKGFVEAFSFVREKARTGQGLLESVIVLVRGLTGTPMAVEQCNAE